MHEQVDAGASEYSALIDQLEAKRQELLDLRQTEVWAAIYPSPTLTNEPSTAALCGAKKCLQEPHLPGLQSGLVAYSVFNLLRADAGFCESVAPAEQAAAERGVSVGELTGRDARWIDGKVDLVGPEFPATWGGSSEEKAEAERVESYTRSHTPPRLRGVAGHGFYSFTMGRMGSSRRRALLQAGLPRGRR